MHELDTVERVINLIADQATQQGFTQVREATLSVGKMNGLEISYFTDQIVATFNEGPLANTKLVVNEVPVELFCNHCGNLYVDSRFDDHRFAHATSHAPELYLAPPCPECGRENARVMSGTEMRLISIEGD